MTNWIQKIKIIETSHLRIFYSPFHSYFEKEIKRFELINNENEKFNSNKQFVLNEFYSPKLFKIIQDYLHLLPLWTGIMIDQASISYETKTRVCNNPGETGFLRSKII